MAKNQKGALSELLLRLWDDVCPCACDSVWDYQYLKRLTNITEAIVDIIPKQIIVKVWILYFSIELLEQYLGHDHLIL